MVCIGGDAPDSKENQGFEGANIFIGAPEGVHVIIVVSAAAGGTAETVGDETRLFRVNALHQSQDGGIVEIHVGDGGEQSLKDQPVGFFCYQIFVAFRGAGESNQRSGQLILEPGRFRRFPAYAGFSRTAGTSGCLLTLEAKHAVFHRFISPFAVPSADGEISLPRCLVHADYAVAFFLCRPQWESFVSMQPIL